MEHIVHGEEYCMGLHRDHFWDLCYSIFFFVMYSTFSIATDIASCADDMTPHNTNWTEELVINKLDETSSILFK